MRSHLEHLLHRFSTRSVVILILVAGSLALAIADPAYRPLFSDFAKIGLGGYLGQLIPKRDRGSDQQ